MKLHIRNFPPDIVTQYKLQEKVTSDGYIFRKIKKGMYGLKRAAFLAYENLVTNFKKIGYEPIPHTVGMWKHQKREICFCLCVDDFRIKYFSHDDAQHLLDALTSSYNISID